MALSKFYFRSKKFTMGAILSKYGRQLKNFWQRADSAELIALVAGVPLLLFQFIHPLINWKRLWRRVPVLFDLGGYPSKMGGKWTLFLVPCLSMFIAHEYIFAPGVTKMFTIGTKHERVCTFLLTMMLTAYYGTTQVRTALGGQSRMNLNFALYLLSGAASSFFFGLWREVQTY